MFFYFICSNYQMPLKKSDLPFIAKYSDNLILFAKPSPGQQRVGSPGQ